MSAWVCTSWEVSFKTQEVVQSRSQTSVVNGFLCTHFSEITVSAKQTPAYNGTPVQAGEKTYLLAIAACAAASLAIGTRNGDQDT
ncbi:MAG: hypothetical protein LIO92_04595 [Clostridiales bacterium]|nr:hypothetical protein [Clostridiales bacterium]